jgi:hypothetical protein
MVPYPVTYMQELSKKFANFYFIVLYVLYVFYFPKANIKTIDGY